MDRLRQTFATHGLPLVIVSDNATAFTSSEFSVFLKGPGASWVPGTITAADGQICTVQLADGRVFTRHRDHVRARVCAQPSCLSGQADPTRPIPETTVPAFSARAPDALWRRAPSPRALHQRRSLLRSRRGPVRPQLLRRPLRGRPPTRRLPRCRWSRHRAPSDHAAQRAFVELPRVTVYSVLSYGELPVR